MDLSCYPEQSGGIMLESIDMTEPKMSKEEYRSEYDSLISRLIVLQQKARSEEVGLVVLFEGWKGAGKGSRISDLVYHLDARGTSVHVAKGYGTQETMHIPEGPFGATGFFPPMQQFWKALGTRGSMTFFDCGWYTLATQYMIDRAIAAKKRGRTPEKYDLLRRVLRVVPSIESFESQLVSDGYVVVKFFFHISEETQRERLEGLHADPAMRWRVSEEAFFAPLKKAISNAKFRASYGSLGNNSGVGRYEQKETMGTTNYIVGNNGLATGFSANKMINQDLSWEETRVINIGLDLGFFNNRLTAELDWYDRFTTGMIRGSSISSLLTGYSAPNINVADLRNRGIEVNLNWQSSIRKFEYSVNVNASYNVNKLEKWGDYLNRGWIMLDMPYHFLYIYEAYPGLVQSWNQLYNAPYQGDAYNAPGDIILKDLNGDGKISDLDKKAYTDKYRDTPMGQFGITLTGAYQGFDIQALFQGNYGRSDVWLDDLNNTKIPDNRYAFQQFHWSDSWSLDNRGASLPRLLNGSGGNKNREESTYWAYNTNYFRLKNLQVGYTVPERYMQRIGFNRARIYLSGENLFTLTPWKGIDPEKPHGNDLYPLVKTYSIGLNIEF